MIYIFNRFLPNISSKYLPSYSAFKFSILIHKPGVFLSALFKLLRFIIVAALALGYMIGMCYIGYLCISESILLAIIMFFISGVWYLLYRIIKAIIKSTGDGGASPIWMYKVNKKNYRNLIQNGRKSMATIVKIEYVGATDKDYPDFIHGYNAIRPLSDTFKYKKQSYLRFSSDALPVFKLTYTFNPPDDSLKEDLVHSIYVPFDPAQSLKPGEMLPILYYINPNDNSVVTSTPFPYPAGKVFRLEDVICTTQNNFIGNIGSV